MDIRPPQQASSQPESPQPQPVPHAESQPKPRKSRKGLPVKLGIALGIIVLLVAAIIVIGVAQRRSQVSSNSNESIVKQVGKVYELPVGEQPDIATVTDKTLLTKNAAFSKAENGDKVMVYKQAKLMIIYRPSTKKIVTVAQLSSSSQSGK